jgi:hypothetical protein
MSIDVMTKIIQRCTLTGSQRLALLVMGQWCDDDGESLYPSIELVAEAMQVSRSQAQRVLRSLMPADDQSDVDDHWWVRVVGNVNGGAPGATRRYQMNVARLDALPKLPAFEKAEQRRRQRAETGRMGATGSMSATGSMDATRNAGDGPHGCDPTGRMDATRLVKRNISKRESARDDLFEQALKRWPVVDSPKAAREAWSILSPDDRLEAASEIERFVGVNRSAGRKLICSFARYLSEQMWKGLPERPKRTSLPSGTMSTAPAPPKSKFLMEFERQKAGEAGSATP